MGKVLPDTALFDGRTAKTQCPTARPLRAGAMLAISGIVRIVHLLSCVQQLSAPGMLQTGAPLREICGQPALGDGSMYHM